MPLVGCIATWILAVGCGFASDVTFGQEALPFDPLDPMHTGGGSGMSSGSNNSSGGASSGSSGTPAIPVTCSDGIRNGAETDVDCGTICAAPCGVSKGCETSADCIEKVCAAGLCQPPTGTDGVQNGDESGIDCGGTLTGAARCPVGGVCVVNTDCESRGCSNGLCIDAPSCVAVLGGSTCGEGEVGSGNEQHESCCTSLEVPGYADAAHPGKRVFLDKYEITAGRMRAFVDAMAAQYNGQPDIATFIGNNQPDVWSPGWTNFMPSGTDGAMVATPNGGAHGTGSGCGAECNAGTNYQFGAALYQYTHGHNCYHGGGSSFGYSTYWYPDAVMIGQNGGNPRAYSQDILDVKSLNCTTSAMLQAFCFWDGGQLATLAVMNTVGAAASGNRSGDGSQRGSYYFPGPGSGSDDAARVAAPGRVAEDSRMYAGAGPWMDMRGNLSEIMLSGGAFAVTTTFGGLGEGSAHAGGNSDEWLSHPEYKSALAGGRCMRFKN